MHLSTGCFEKDFCSQVEFLKIRRTDFVATWSDRIVMSRERNRIELLKTLSIPKMRKLAGNNNNINFYCNIIMYPYSIVKKKFRSLGRRENIRNLVGIFVLY